MLPDLKQDLGSFLRTHRERLRASDVGLKGSRDERRRTPGLRREEVAMLCGMSPTWYTWLEQGRDISVSADGLGRIAEALRLNRAERAYLFELARRQDPAAAPVAPTRDTAPPALAAVLAATPVPAYCLDRLWCACGSNAAAAHLFRDWIHGSEPCLLRYVFLDPSACRLIVDWPERARRLVAEFRADTSRLAADPAMAALVAGLRQDSPAFAAHWADHDVLSREGGMRRFRHPEDGPLLFEQITLLPTGHEGFKIVMLLPQENSLNDERHELG